MHVHFPSQRRRPSAASPSHLGSRRVRHPPTPGCCKHRGIICFGNRSSTYFSLFSQEPLPVTGLPCRGRGWPFSIKNIVRGSSQLKELQVLRRFQATSITLLLE